jgi:hypothetical protein
MTMTSDSGFSPISVLRERFERELEVDPDNEEIKSELARIERIEAGLADLDPPRK